jgi:short-subunit dehydrogenase
LLTKHKYFLQSGFSAGIPIGSTTGSLAFELDLAGRTALLTGATGGLGRAIAKALAERGAILKLSARKPQALEGLAAELPGGEHEIVPADLAEPGAAEELAAAAGPVDLLVANAGLPGAGRMEEFSADEIKRALRVNLEAPMLLAQALYPVMLEKGSGHLVFIASLSGKAPSPHSSIYNATKFGLRGFALGLRADLSPQGIGVSIVSPGFIREAGMFAESGARPPAGLGTATPEAVASGTVKAIEADKVEVVVAPMQQRFLAHFGLVSPAIAVRAASGAAGQKAAAEVAAGHSKDKR